MIGKYKLSVVVSSSNLVDITEEVKNLPRQPYRAPITTAPLTKKQALELGLLLIKAAQS
jgi:hypothetical protein